MKRFTHETIGYKHYPAYKAFREFFDGYLLERDYEKTLSFVEDDIYGLGIAKDDVVTGKAELEKLLKAELESIPAPIEYNVTSICGKEIAENIWNIQAAMELLLPSSGTSKVIYTTRYTGSFRLYENRFVLLSTHMSEPSRITEDKEFLPIKFANNNTSIDKSKMDKIIFDIVSQTMPGGIISGYAEEGFPIYFVNDQYLELLGYSSYEEYYQSANGLGITHIHPDDRALVNKETMHSYSADTQYGIEYRIRHKDGHYIHVYDIGKKMVTPDNKELIICVLYDMTEDANLKEILIRESSYDALTGIYNRGAGIRTIEQKLKYENTFSFAFFDIDNLKQINDIYNHKGGDHALKHFAELLTKHFDNRTVFARIGGDEFIAFFSERSDQKHIETIFSRLEQAYCQFISQNYPHSHSSVSIGCVTGTKECTFDELYQAADKLMYDIKKNGKKGYKIIELD